MQSASDLAAAPALRRHGVHVLKAVAGCLCPAGIAGDAEEEEEEEVDPAVVRARLVAAGKRHAVRYDVAPGSFGPVADAVAWVVGEALGEFAAQDIENGWREATAKVVALMTTGKGA